MVNPHRGEATLKLDGEPDHVIRIDFNAVAEIMDETGVDPTEMAEALQRSKAMVFLRAALAAGLSTDRKRVTPRQAGALIGAHLQEVDVITAAVVEALRRYFTGPNAEGTNADPLPPAPPSPAGTPGAANPG